MKKARIIMLGVIIVICIIAVGIGIYIQMAENDYKTAVDKTNNNESIEDKISEIKNQFKNIFQNDISGSYSNIEKINEDKDIVYVSAQKQEAIPNKYNLDVQIPEININNEQIKKCNNEIKSIFQNKAAIILSQTGEYTVYNVKYHAYINENILSLIIKANLKEGENPEREIIKTYNYNLETNSIMTISDIINFKNFDKDNIQIKINEEIKIQNEYNESLLKLGYQVFKRNINDEMYKIENTNNFILGENGYLYLIYAYGNSNYTSEKDLIIIE